MKQNTLVIEGNIYSYQDIVEQKHLTQISGSCCSPASDSSASSVEKEVRDAPNKIHSEPMLLTTNQENKQQNIKEELLELKKRKEGKRMWNFLKPAKP